MSLILVVPRVFPLLLRTGILLPRTVIRRRMETGRVAGMNDLQVARIAGSCALIGGGAWVAAVLIHASLPEGCIDEQCISGGPPVRDATPAGAAFALLALVMLAAGGVALGALANRTGRPRKAGRVGVILTGLGAASLVLARPLSLLLNDYGDLMPGFVVFGLVALAVGVALIGWTVLRSRVLPRWAGVLLVLSLVPLLFANEQTDLVLFALPFGLAWVLVGFVLIAGRSTQASVTS